MTGRNYPAIRHDPSRIVTPFATRYGSCILDMSGARVERLTLSFPFQIKSKIILFTSLTKSLPVDIKLARYKKIGIIDVLTIWILPIIVKSLHFQIRNLCWIELISSSGLEGIREVYTQYFYRFPNFYIMNIVRNDIAFL